MRHSRVLWFLLIAFIAMVSVTIFLASGKDSHIWRAMDDTPELGLTIVITPEVPAQGVNGPIEVSFGEGWESIGWPGIHLTAKMGDVVRLHPVRIDGFVFAGWRNSCDGSLSDCEVVFFDKSRQVTAQFVKLQQ
jgi:hypothetical protein